MTSWYVLRSKPRKEDMVWHQARMRGFDVFYPRLRVQPVNPRARKIRPYFPGYMFIKADLGAVGQSIFQYMPHSLGLVRFGGEPAMVPEALVRAIMHRTRELDSAGGELFDGLKKGDRVSVQAGPFKGYEGIFDVRLSGMDRVRILLEMLNGRTVPVELRAGLIERQDRI